MADVRPAEDSLGEATDADHLPPRGEFSEKRQTCLDLLPGRSTVGRLGAGVGRHDVPEQDLLLETELGEDAVDDRGRRFARRRTRDLPLRRERQAGDTRAAVARRFADE
jgi:hypothetical protein